MSRAVIYEKFGGPEVLQLKDITEPHPSKGEVRVRVASAALNPMDYTVLSNPDMAAQFGVFLPSGFGSDFSGTVDEVGEEVTDFHVGDRVYGSLLGRPIADFVIAKERDLLHTPDGINDEIASTLPVPGRTAIAALDAINFQRGDTILIGGASGGVGVFAVQLAKHARARVIGTSSESTFDFLRELGAEPVAYGEGLVERVRAIASEGISAATDLFGNEAGNAALELGVAPDRISTIAAFRNPVKGAHATGAAYAKPSALDDVADAIIAGDLVVPIEARFPIEQIQDAVQLLSKQHTHGKILVTL